MDAYVPTELKESSFKVFEEACLDIKHSVCPCCHQVGMNVNIGRSGVCSDCCSFNDVNYLLKNDCLPIWYKDGQPQFHIPEELACLTMAEKMLIQLCSPFIPLRHIKNEFLACQDMCVLSNRILLSSSIHYPDTRRM